MLDLHMPGMSGVQLQEVLAREHPIDLDHG